MGGEKLLSEWGQGWPLGSPPRGRGKAIVHLPFVLRVGITPAWAGKRLTVEIRLTRHKDHPRAGGEKAELTAAVISAMGSPPHGRGKGHTGSERAGLGGITPAWAGKSTPPPLL